MAKNTVLAVVIALVAGSALAVGTVHLWHPYLPSVRVSSTKGSPSMTDASLRDRLQGLDQLQTDRAAERIATDARRFPTEAVALWQSGEAPLAEQAERVLAILEELALVPLLETPVPKTPEQRLWQLTTLVEAEQAVRQRIIAKLNEALDDKRYLELPAPRPSERRPPRRRVCDQAYLLTRRVVHYGESLEQSLPQAEEFIHAPEEIKDRHIKAARSSMTWNHALTGQDVDPPNSDQ